jgi:hypothetical protein
MFDPYSLQWTELGSPEGVTLEDAPSVETALTDDPQAVYWVSMPGSDRSLYARTRAGSTGWRPWERFEPTPSAGGAISRPSRPFWFCFWIFCGFAAFVG